MTTGRTDPGAARDHISQMTIRQNNWTVGTYCESYCRIVTTHHTIEDRSVFPHLRGADPRLAPVIDRLEQEHVAIHGVLEQLDRALVAFVSGPDGDKQLRGRPICSPTRCSATSRTRSGSWSNRWPGWGSSRRPHRTP